MIGWIVPIDTNTLNKYDNMTSPIDTQEMTRIVNKYYNTSSTMDGTR